MKNLLAGYNLPKRVEVGLHKAKEGGYVVEFPGLPGCYTQVEDLSKLHENVTDAILTYFDVPRKEANKMVYIPETKRIAKVSATRESSRVSLTQAHFDLFVAA